MVNMVYAVSVVCVFGES